MIVVEVVAVVLIGGGGAHGDGDGLQPSMHPVQAGRYHQPGTQASDGRLAGTATGSIVFVSESTNYQGTPPAPHSAARSTPSPDPHHPRWSVDPRLPWVVYKKHPQ